MADVPFDIGKGSLQITGKLVELNDRLDISPSAAAYLLSVANLYGTVPFTLWDAVFDALSSERTGYLGINDTHDWIHLPVGSYVLAAGCEVLVPDATANSPTISLGTTTAATQFLNGAFNPKAAAGTTVASALSTALVVTTATKLRTTINTAALTDAKFRVFAVIGQFGKHAELY